MLTTLAMVVALLAPARMSKIEIDVSPEDARIEVDGKVVEGKLAKVSAGRHVVRASKDGYQTTSRTVTTKGGDAVSVKLRLRVAKEKGRRKIATVTKRPGKPIGRPKPTPRAEPVAKRPSARTPSAKTPSAKTPAAKTPVAKAPSEPEEKPSTRTPETMTPPVAKRPTAKRPTGRRPVAKAPVKRRPDARPPIKRRPVAAGPAPVDGGGVSGGASPSGRTSTKPYAVLAFVVAGLAVTGGVIAGLAADGAADDFNQSTDRGEKTKFKRDSENLALGANIAYGVGATAAVVGAVLWAMDDTDDGYAVRAGPLPEGGAIVGIGGVF